MIDHSLLVTRLQPTFDAFIRELSLSKEQSAEFPVEVLVHTHDTDGISALDMETTCDPLQPLEENAQLLTAVKVMMRVLGNDEKARFVVVTLGATYPDDEAEKLLKPCDVDLAAIAA